MAVSCMSEGVLPITQTSMRFFNHIGYHDYEGPAIDLDEQERIVAHLGEHNALVHGHYGVGG
jgi:ribulose-5-phosphate 4-epimerase/fuculose-1-phosphate aldolase